MRRRHRAARVVHEDVDAAVGVDHPGDEGVDRPVVALIAHPLRGTFGAAGDVGGRRQRGELAARAPDDGRALEQQLPRDPDADAAARPRHDRDLAVQLAHGPYLSSSRRVRLRPGKHKSVYDLAARASSSPAPPRGVTCRCASSSSRPATSGATRCDRSSNGPTSSSSACTPAVPTRSVATRPSCAVSTDPTGVVATDDVDALVALRADCVVYTSQAETRPDAALAEITAFLAAGTNVVGTSLVWLVYPPHADAWLREPLEAACAAGGTTMYVNGIDPGFSGDLLPARRAEPRPSGPTTILVQEICDYGSYDDAEFTGVSFGFGTTPDIVPMLFLPGVLASIWGGPVQLLADELGVVVDEMRERYETWTATETIECTMMTVAPGEVAAVRFAVEGIVDGRPAIVMEHVNRLTVGRRARLAGTARRPAGRAPRRGQRRPRHRDQHPRRQRRTPTTTKPGVIATAAKAVNAIAAVCAAPPGLTSLRDLPVSQVRGLMR